MTDLKNLPDRDLDAWLAEHVMGWRAHFRNTAHYVLAAQEGTTYDRPQAWISKWHPSTDPAASKALRDRIRELGWIFEMHDTAVSEGFLFSVRVRRIHTNAVEFIGFISHGNAEERAVAEAAALAMGYGKENERG